MAPCESCHAGCCRAFAVPVHGADIISIERQQGLSFWDFVCRWVDPEGTIARGRVPHFFFPDAPNVPFVLCLIQSPSVFFPGTSKCRFLLECPPDEAHPSGQARCAIYGARPSACRVFPTKFNTTSDLVILCDLPPSPQKENQPIYELCPREWKVDEIDPIQSMQDQVVTKYEYAYFAEVARAWNESPRPWRVFPDFLRLVYSHRVRRETPADHAATATEQSKPNTPGAARCQPIVSRAAA